MAAKKKKSHVFGSFRHSTNLSRPASRQQPVRHLCQFHLVGHALLDFEVFVLDPGLVHLDALDRNNALLGREEPRVRRRVREEEPARVRSIRSVPVTQRYPMQGRRDTETRRTRTTRRPQR